MPGIGKVYSKLLVPIVQSSFALKSVHLNCKLPMLPTQRSWHCKSSFMPISCPEFIVLWSQKVSELNDLRQPIRNVIITWKCKDNFWQFFGKRKEITGWSYCIFLYFQNVCTISIPQGNTVTRISNLVSRVSIFSLGREDERPLERGGREKVIHIKPRLFLRQKCFTLYNSCETLQTSSMH